MIGGWALSAVAWATPALELPDPAPESWRDAAVLAGFRLGPCERVCARLTEGGLQVVWADGAIHEVPHDEPEIALALARSRLALGRVEAARPVASPRPARESPAEVAAPSPQWVVAPVPRVGADDLTSVQPHTAFVLSRAGPEARLPLSATWWASAWAGASAGALLGAQVGVRRGPWLAGLGGRMDGSLTVDAGVGATGQLGPVRLIIGTWVGAEAWLMDCLGCTVEVHDNGQQVEVTTSSVFWVPPGASGMGPVARAEMQLGVPLGRRWLLAPRGGFAVSAVGARPELAVAVIRSGR